MFHITTLVFRFSCEGGKGLDVVDGDVASVAALFAALVALLVELEANVALTAVAVGVRLVDLGVLG